MTRTLALPYAVVGSPVGPLTLLADGAALAGLYLQDQRHRPDLTGRRDDDLLPDVRRQLDEWFAGSRTHFDVEISLQGTEFQRSVWSALQAVPYAETCSYADLAREVGRPAATRAVGLANGRNPVSIVVPCHRVVGASGSLTGYGGGLERKAWLLDHEQRHARRSA